MAVPPRGSHIGGGTGSSVEAEAGQATGKAWGSWQCSTIGSKVQRSRNEKQDFSPSFESVSWGLV